MGATSVAPILIFDLVRIANEAPMTGAVWNLSNEA